MYCLRLREVRRGRIARRHVPGRFLRVGPGHLGAHPELDRRVQLLLVGGVLEREAQVQVVERLRVRVQHDEGRDVEVLQVDVVLLARLDLLDLSGLTGVHELDLARLERLEPGRRVRQHVEDDRVHVREALAPVVGVLRDRQRAVLDPALEDERPGADRVRRRAGLRLELGRGGHVAGLRGQHGREGDPRLAHVDLHGEVVDRRRLHHRQQRLADERGGTIEGQLEHDGRGIQRLAVGELDAGAQPDRPGLVVRAVGDRLGEEGHGHSRLVVGAERVEERLGDVVGGAGPLARRRVPAVRLGIESHTEGPAVLRGHGRRRRAAPRARRGTRRAARLRTTRSDQRHDDRSNGPASPRHTIPPPATRNNVTNHCQCRIVLPRVVAGRPGARHGRVGGAGSTGGADDGARGDARPPDLAPPIPTGRPSRVRRCCSDMTSSPLISLSSGRRHRCRPASNELGGGWAGACWNQVWQGGAPAPAPQPATQPAGRGRQITIRFIGFIDYAVQAARPPSAGPQEGRDASCGELPRGGGAVRRRVASRRVAAAGRAAPGISARPGTGSTRSAGPRPVGSTSSRSTTRSPSSRLGAAATTTGWTRSAGASTRCWSRRGWRRSRRRSGSCR